MRMEVPQAIKDAYIKQSAEPVKFDVARLEAMGLEVVKKDIASIQDGVVRHETNHVAEWLVEYTKNYQQKKQSPSN